VTEQPRYSLINRAIEVAVLPTAQRYDMGVLSYSPLANGWLSGRDPASLRRARLAPAIFDTSTPANAHRVEIVQALAKIAEQAGLPLAHMATGFVRAHPGMTSVIIGPRTPHQLQESIAASDVVLTEDVLDAIDQVVAPGTEVSPDDSHLATPSSLADPKQRRLK
jgi:aryl-alcohol dehydrogenase-like predicted oxidoreductase